MARFRWGYGVVRNGAWEKRVTALHRPTAVAEFLKLATAERESEDSNVQLLLMGPSQRRYTTVVQTVGPLVFLWAADMGEVVDALRKAGFNA